MVTIYYMMGSLCPYRIIPVKKEKIKLDYHYFAILNELWDLATAYQA